jgi:Ca2+-binding RTX toxin-like protein
LRGFLVNVRIVVACIAALLLIQVPAVSAAACPGKTIKGTAGANTLKGTCGPDVIYGRGGNDKILGLGGNDKLFGEGGNDTLDGGPGRDALSGAAGTDTITFGASPQGVTINLGSSPQKASGGHATGDKPSSIESVTGSSKTDRLTGSNAKNILKGGGGNDVVNGGGGNDVLTGDAGSDKLAGGSGNDSMNAGTGSDELDGGEGADSLTGPSSPDVQDEDILRGGPGGDNMQNGSRAILDYTGSPSGVTVNLETQTASGGDAVGDTFQGIGHVRGSEQDDTLSGQTGGTHGSGFLDGGLGADTFNVGGLVTYGPSPDAVTINLGDGAPEMGGFASGDVINIANPRIFGSAFSDNITGNNERNELHGGNGDDTLDGGAGNDFLVPGSGNDAVIGGSDDGVYITESSPGTGDYQTSFGDQVFYGFSSVAISVNLQTGTAAAEGTDTLTGIEFVEGSNLDDTLIGNSSRNVLHGGFGNDSISGAEESDILDGGDGPLDSLDGGAGGETYWGFWDPTTGNSAYGDFCSDIDGGQPANECEMFFES